MGRYSLRTIHQEFNLIQLKIYLYVNSLIKLKMFTANLPTGRSITPALIVVDMQNGFVAKGGSYDRIGMNLTLYREIIPTP